MSSAACLHCAGAKPEWRLLGTAALQDAAARAAAEQLPSIMTERCFRRMQTVGGTGDVQCLGLAVINAGNVQEGGCIACGQPRGLWTVVGGGSAALKRGLPLLLCELCFRTRLLAQPVKHAVQSGCAVLPLPFGGEGAGGLLRGGGDGGAVAVSVQPQSVKEPVKEAWMAEREALAALVPSDGSAPAHPAVEAAEQLRIVQRLEQARMRGISLTARSYTPAVRARWATAVGAAKASIASDARSPAAKASGGAAGGGGGGGGVDGGELRALAKAAGMAEQLEALMAGGSTEVTVEERCESDAVSRFVAAALKAELPMTVLRLMHGAVDDEGVQAICAAMDGNTTVSALILTDNALGDAAAEAVAAALSSGCALAYLDMVENNLTAVGAAALATALASNRTLTFLGLSNNVIRCAGASALAVALQENRTLTDLWLACNQIGDSGAIALSQALRNNRTLQELLLYMNDVSNKGAGQLVRSLKKCKTLTRLELSDNPRIVGRLNRMRLKMKRRAVIRL
eukprot:PLAT5971.1.p1 GENE.PLAT5971.1~~PLAT5971.1.p1  ORF type:complete len:514 (-),score=182.01 PLAT5971.1:42-1583(-)